MLCTYIYVDTVGCCSSMSFFLLLIVLLKSSRPSGVSGGGSAIYNLQGETERYMCQSRKLFHV